MLIIAEIIKSRALKWLTMSVAATRFGHTEGRVCLAYNLENKKIVSVGSDGEMRVWAGQTQSHDMTHVCVMKILF